MKNLFCSLIFIMCGLALFAQPTSGTTVYAKVPQSSLIYDLPFSEDIVYAALQEKMNAYKVAPKKVKGFYVYRSVVVPEISSQPVNLYFSVDKKSKRDKNSASLSMLIANDKDVFLQSGNEVDLFRRGKEFLNSFNADANMAQHNAEVSTQEKEVDKLTKKVKQLESEQNDLRKKIKKMEDDISKNEKDLKAETENLEAQKKQLEILKTKN